MIKGNVIFLDDSPVLPVTIGVGEDVKAPRDLAAMEKAGWVIDDGVRMSYKAWLAGKRQGDIPVDSKFENWIDNVAEIDMLPTRKQVEQAVLMGSMDQEQADKLLAYIEADEGEAVAPPA